MDSPTASKFLLGLRLPFVLTFCGKFITMGWA